jgi:DNA-binding response OmpR family regulator
MGEHGPRQRRLKPGYVAVDKPSGQVSLNNRLAGQKMWAPSKRRVLVVDDESGMNEYVADILEKAGFDVFAATDGVAAVEAFHSSKPDVMILDIFMPKKDGLEVLIELRHQRVKVPVLVISGKQLLLSDSSMGLAKQLGANDVLGKPFTPEELVAHVSCLAQAAADEPSAPAINETNFFTFRRCVDVLKSRFRRSGRK